MNVARWSPIESLLSAWARHILLMNLLHPDSHDFSHVTSHGRSRVLLNPETHPSQRGFCVVEACLWVHALLSGRLVSEARKRA